MKKKIVMDNRIVLFIPKNVLREQKEVLHENIVSLPLTP